MKANDMSAADPDRNDDISGLEWKCRATWELYCRMERSELK